jgi:hypothetical protein
MPVNPKMSVRKLVAFRRTKFAEIDRFRSDLGLKSEGAAIRALVDAGLAAIFRHPAPKPLNTAPSMSEVKRK